MNTIKTTSTELERKAHEAAQNQIRLAAYYQKKRKATKSPVRLPLKHAHLFKQGALIK